MENTKATSTPAPLTPKGAAPQPTAVSKQSRTQVVYSRNAPLTRGEPVPAPPADCAPGQETPVYGNLGLLSHIGTTDETVRPARKLRFKPPSWHNFAHDFLPCYGGQLLGNFLGSSGKAGTTTGTLALFVNKPKLGGPLFVLWTFINAHKAGAECAFASRAVYE